MIRILCPIPNIFLEVRTAFAWRGWATMRKSYFRHWQAKPKKRRSRTKPRGKTRKVVAGPGLDKERKRRRAFGAAGRNRIKRARTRRLRKAWLPACVERLGDNAKILFSALASQAEKAAQPHQAEGKNKKGGSGSRTRQGAKATQSVRRSRTQPHKESPYPTFTQGLVPRLRGEAGRQCENPIFGIGKPSRKSGAAAPSRGEKQERW